MVAGQSASAAFPYTPTIAFSGTISRRDAQLGAAILRVLLTERPSEAAQALARIRAEGPYLHAQDGAIFFNRQKLLPNREVSFYREYTVETPGSPNRGPRRLAVGGEGAELYYTDDHY
jgi:ribonuclease T1